MKTLAPTSVGTQRAFTLVELLTVVSLVALLGTMTVPVISKAAFGGRFNRALIDLSTAMERAQAYAQANNTYTFVAVTEPDSDGRITLGVFGSRDGSPGVSDISKNSGQAYTVVEPKSEDDSSLVALDRLATLDGVKLDDTLPPANSLVLGAASTWSKNGATFSYRGRTFTRAVQFTPGGEARVSSLVPEAVRVIAIPLKGDAKNSVQDVAGASAIQVAGLTGSVTVQRPGALTVQ